MYTLKQTPVFEQWINSLRAARHVFGYCDGIENAQRGLLGDVAPVGDGVYEMREFFGSGWRMYYIRLGDTLIVMLGGGDKSSQVDDIKAAKALAASLTE